MVLKCLVLIAVMCPSSANKSPSQRQVTKKATKKFYYCPARFCGMVRDFKAWFQRKQTLFKANVLSYDNHTYPLIITHPFPDSAFEDHTAQDA